MSETQQQPTEQVQVPAVDATAAAGVVPEVTPAATEGTQAQEAPKADEAGKGFSKSVYPVSNVREVKN
ncbi:uncharacterized protein L199_008169 [Kwoniella botswanensis]|uniref:uncharacterized protein n=1 Tax=Kwoniella botswanensis TaxID=1268659 RepID=UPI00315DFB2D